MLSGEKIIKDRFVQFGTTDVYVEYQIISMIYKLAVGKIQYLLQQLYHFFIGKIFIYSSKISDYFLVKSFCIVRRLKYFFNFIWMLVRHTFTFSNFFF